MVLKQTKAWKYFSLWGRKNNSVCYTCGKTGNYKEFDFGHFFHKSSMMFFERVFVRTQCVRCNRWLHGNLGIYASKLIQEIGMAAMIIAEKKSHKRKNWKPRELEEIYQEYKNLNMSKEIQVDEKEIKVKIKKQCIHKGIAGVSCFLASCGYKKPKKKFDKS